MQRWIVMCAAVLLSFQASGQGAQVTTRILGASFIEAPPGRDKNLVPFGMMSGQEKAEVHIVATFPKHIVADVPTSSSDDAVLASAVFKDKTRMELGSAERGGFARSSADKHSVLLTFSIARLPDNQAAQIEFVGTAKVDVATRLRDVTVNFEPRAGALVSVDKASVTIEEIQANEITLKGDATLLSIAGMSLIGAGKSNPGERTSYFLGNGGGQVTWRFRDPISTGKLQLSLYDGRQIVNVPVRATVARPY